LKNFHPSLLREYDIRGIVGQTLFEEDAYWIGRCFGHVIRTKKGKATAVGRDGRLSSPQLETALVRGLVDSGIDAYCLGVVPTPMLYFAEHTLPVDAAIMVTGSHNPPSHNGFKMSLQRKPFFGEQIQEFSRFVLGDANESKGNIYEKDIQSSYVNRLLQDLKFGKQLTIAWDAGNGSAGNILKDLVLKLPGKHILLNEEIDGNFPSHPPDPSNPENLVQLQQIVIEKNCDLGIAFDGDGDRLAAIDGKGHMLYGDQLLLLFATDLLKRKPNAIIIGDVKASQNTFDEITRLNGQAIMWKTGHSHIKSKMAEIGATLAGEMSGHFFFKEGYYGFDDGIYAALRLLHILSNSSQSLTEFYEGLSSCASTPEIRIPCEGNSKFKIPHNIKHRLINEGYSFSDIDGIRVHHKDGWWLLRASHTQDVLVARCEASNSEGLAQVMEHLRNELAIENIVLDNVE